ncbi:hypothetical protein KIPB_009655 [Kipferlia bialata]|uniref:YbaK/aminoacyl-tRNA synthetase-associated domain-containing protein n=1 Tax=Kipferlia bialata TaxID=797122 RepID=A0A9K3D1Y9_9EUKA|nr:hypothetical protein KIPB_009655 [Kipferlia bialata]|eukprot:g9655.t1
MITAGGGGGVPHDDHLCKVVMFENTAWVQVNDPQTGAPLEELDYRNPRFFMVLVQYSHKIQTQELWKHMRNLGKSVNAPRQANTPRQAGEADALRLSGQEFNGITPVGLKSAMPLLLCKSVTRLSPPYVWIGGADRDVKLGVPVEELIRCYGATVVEMSEKRDD